MQGVDAWPHSGVGVFGRPSAYSLVMRPPNGTPSLVGSGSHPSGAASLAAATLHPEPTCFLMFQRTVVRDTLVKARVLDPSPAAGSRSGGDVGVKAAAIPTSCREFAGFCATQPDRASHPRLRPTHSQVRRRRRHSFPTGDSHPVVLSEWLEAKASLPSVLYSNRVLPAPSAPAAGPGPERSLRP